MTRPSIIVHAGATRVPLAEMAGFDDACRRAARRGFELLAAGAAALDAAVEAVVVLEDDPLPNAGLGSVLNRDGVVENDALVMEGTELKLGAVGALVGVRNPVRVARLLLDEPQLNLVVGAGARRYAEERGVEVGPDDLLVTPRERERWLRHPTEPAGSDTVGAVAMDGQGRVAVAVSTGGIFYKPPGRLGDSPLPGSGAYADDRVGGAVATGVGEAIMRVLLARTALDGLTAGRDAAEAAGEAIAMLAARVQGQAGVIVLDRNGRPGAVFNTPQMAHAWMHRGMDEPLVRH